MAVLDALTRLPLAPECWIELKGYVLSSLGSAAPEHLDVIEPAARVPLRSVRLELLELAEEGGPDERRHAAFALAKVGEERAAAPLLELLDDSAVALTAARHLALVDVSAHGEAVRRACSRFRAKRKGRWLHFWLALALARSGSEEELFRSLAALTGGDAEMSLEWGDRQEWGDPDLLLDELRRGPRLPTATRRRLRKATPKGLLGDLLLEASRVSELSAPDVVDADALHVSAADRARVVAELAGSGLIKDLLKGRFGGLEGLEELRTRFDQVIEASKASADRRTLLALGISELFYRQGAETERGRIEGAANDVTRLVQALGDAYVPDLEGLLSSHRSFTYPGVRQQIAWSASRGGLQFLLGGLARAVSTDPLPAARLIAQAADLSRAAEPPLFYAGGAPVVPGPPGRELMDDTGAEPEAPRWILVRVAEAAERARRLTIAFRAGAVHEIAVAIGPNQEGWSAATGGRPFDEELGPVADKEELRVVFLAPLIGVQQTNSIFLPRTGSSSACTFNVRIPEDIDSFEAEIRVHHRNRVVQMARLRGPVARDPAKVPPGNRIELAVAPIVSGATDLSSQGGVDAGVVRTEAGTTGIAERELVLFDDERLGRVMPALTQILTQLSTGDAARRRKLEDAIDDLRALVFQGCELNAVIGRPIRDQLQDRKLDRLQVLVDDRSDFFPLELVYDLPAPTKDAGLCPGWKVALRTGVCPEPHREKGSRRLARTVCPSGFWALSKVIERKVVGPSSWEQLGLPRPDDVEIAVRAQPSAQHDSVEPPRVVLFAASSKVDAIRKGGISSVRKTLDRISTESTYVETWEAWVAAVKHRPTLLVLLSHTTEEQMQAALEIGRTGDTCLAAQLNSSYVRAATEDAPMPIVLLLGCETAVTDGLQSFVAYFQDYGASLVVGTVASVLGQRAAPLARAIATELAAAAKRRRPIAAGELMTRMRRKLLARGELTALCLTAFGDAGRQLGGRAS